MSVYVPLRVLYQSQFLVLKIVTEICNRSLLRYRFIIIINIIIITYEFMLYRYYKKIKYVSTQVSPQPKVTESSKITQLKSIIH